MFNVSELSAKVALLVGSVAFGCAVTADAWGKLEPAVPPRNHEIGIAVASTASGLTVNVVTITGGELPSPICEHPDQSGTTGLEIFRKST